MKDNLGKTALFLACELGHLDLVKKLYELGACLHTPAIGHIWTPLLIAGYRYHENIVEWLVSKGCQIPCDSTTKENKLFPVEMTAAVERGIRHTWKPEQLQFSLEYFFLPCLVTLIVDYATLNLESWLENNIQKPLAREYRTAEIWFQNGLNPMFDHGCYP
jgi:hypothetical protein